ncbi:MULTISPECIES: hypothetical protein [unclassified Paenibacillus]|uniref:hypothetical protein n=1 Tax=unclassified Paenibacillus TaxID=185978 RepID=UPI00067641E5|nr:MULTISPECIES: hypothetical protein [unclassified Paenibacillus]SFR27805.1 hypothetical protein SAMN04488603_1204 [Paenibacillus sp. cl130]
MNYLISNKDWIFSGIGVVVIGAIINFFRKKDVPKNPAIKYQSGNNNIQSDGTVLVNNNVTNVYKETETELEKKSPLSELINKFFFIFEKHGVSRGQLPSFIDKEFNINYVDVAGEESIIPKLNDELLDWVSTKFGIRRSWFDRADDVYSSRYIYDTLDFYKCTGAFINLFSRLIDELSIYSYRDALHVYFLKTFDDFKSDQSGEEGKANVIVIVSIKIGNTTTNSVERYILIPHNLRWDYWKSRQDIKRMIRIVDKLDIRMSGYDISIDEYNEIGSAQVVPRALLNQKRGVVTWYPYDYDGTINGRINKAEYELDKQFCESLEEIDETISKLIDGKRDYYDKLIFGSDEKN